MTEQQKKKIAEIREALEKATPGPWKWIDPGGLERKKLVGEWEIMNFGASMPYSEVAGQEPDDADAHLIANAPEWLGFLLDEREKMIEWIKSALVGAMKESCRHETPDPTWHCCDWAELVEKAREIGVTVE